jgi:hypothetical protein
VLEIYESWFIRFVQNRTENFAVDMNSESDDVGRQESNTANGGGFNFTGFSLPHSTQQMMSFVE